MASFTDLIPQFNPYVQQLPVEAMVQVGTYKQQKYEEGLQKIQSQVSQVAGLDIMNSADKKYLQSKLNELGNNLTTVAAGDFSNFQLVNSVGGMIGQIAKDPNIVNAVSSTAWYRKQLEKMQKDVDEGKSSPANVYKFQKNADAWMNSDKVGQKFSESYIPHFDVFKFAKETFDAVQPDGYSFDQVYVTNPDGSIKMGADGKPVYSPVMVRLEKEGKFPDKVKQTVEQIFSDPRVAQQLAISGEYNFRGYSPEELSVRAEQTKSSLLEGLNDKLADLMLDKRTGKKDVQDQIDAVNLQIENITNKYDQYKQIALENPDAIRGAMYKDDVSARYTTMFGGVKTKTQSLTNPGWQANFDLMKEANVTRRFNQEMSLRWAAEKRQADQDIWERGYKMLELQLKGKKLNLGMGEVGTIQDFMPTDSAAYMAQFDQAYTNAANKFDTASDNMIFSLALDTPVNREKLAQLVNKGMSREQAMNALITNAAKLNNEDPSSFRNRWLEKSVEKINQMDPTKLEQDPILKGVYDAYSSAKQDFSNLNATKKQIDSRLDKNILDALSSSQMGKDLKDVQVTINGKPVTITGEDLWNAAVYARGNQSVFGFLNSSELREQAKIAEQKLRQSGKGFLADFAIERAIVPEGSAGEALLQGVIPVTGFIRGAKGLARNIFGDQIGGADALRNQLNSVYNSLNDDVLMSAVKAKNDAIKASGFSVSPNLRMQLLTGDAETDRGLMNFVATTAGNYETNQQNLSPDFSGSKISDVLNKKDVLKPFELKTSRNDATGQVFPEVVFYDETGKRVAGMSITGEEAARMGVNTSTLYELPSIRNIRTRIDSNPIESTSAGDPTSVNTYVSGDVLFEKKNMPKLAGTPYDVKANIKKVDGAYYGILYVNDGKSAPKVRPLPPTQDLGEAISKLQSTSPQLVTAILNEK
ncbi:MAG: hypothetical protein EBR30_01945 [Cytophagia bacterium]|nr:hypothetical protein [Cytophagia bacterium]